MRLYEYFETQKHILFVIEICAGGDLLNYVRKRRQLKEEVAKSVFKQLIKDELFWPPIIATTKQLKAATAKVKKILQLPARDQRAQLKTNIERRLYRKLKWKAQRNESGDVDFEVK